MTGSSPTLWSRWVDRCNRPTDARPWALVRIFLPLVLLLDLAQVAHHGLLLPLWGTHAQGGIGQGTTAFLSVLGDAGLPVTLALAVAGLLGVMTGVGGRWANLVAVVALAQLQDLFPIADRGIDRLIRSVLLVMMGTDAHRCWTLSGWLGRRGEVRTTAGWAVDILHLFLTIVYFTAGLGKIYRGDWLSFSEDSMLYRVMTDPMAGWLDPHSRVWKTLTPLFGVGGALTLGWELTAFVLLTRYAHWFAVFGVFMHLGIAMTMKLGAFSWAMLSLYPVLLAPLLGPLFDRLDRLFLRTARARSVDLGGA